MDERIASASSGSATSTSTTSAISAIDVDADGYPDVSSVSWFAKRVAWWRNPGKAARDGEVWKETPIQTGFNVEFALLVDLDNDGKAQEILAQENGTGQAWYEVKDKAWVAHVVSARTYGHGIGDRRRQRRQAQRHPHAARLARGARRSACRQLDVPSRLGGDQHAGNPCRGAAQARSARARQRARLHARVDVNGDGSNDVITAAGHDYGVFWFEQGEGGTWTRRMIDSAWSQGHASTLVDLNGDGRLDLVTGKRFMAHNGGDPGEKEPLGVYWYEFGRVRRRRNGSATSSTTAGAWAEGCRFPPSISMATVILIWCAQGRAGCSSWRT